ncbi:transcription antitermination factor NusB [Calditerrivibrio nitroreducens]|uniref:NusB antitermination factor n=1 Tax=Calditerrivibrio nitroreducens (strain DSM 19672 / NBRC 101217 / Yu37-1) TaxID=768670 RepID=E4TFJ0_CALNY|nr:transcription antitermination factor NusB [Calditerrivibrio nitroreducens]ADR19563.1 NusB antitermination factor [Calditerrivibrio nitroreducens DSM 19672]
MGGKRLTKIRKYALNLYYMHLQNGELLETIVDSLVKYNGFNKEILLESLGLLKKAIEKTVFLDELISKYLKQGWDLNRLPMVDLLILRLAIFELFESNDPIKVIDDYVTLANKYSEQNSPGYINGILEKIKNDFGLHTKNG